MPALPSYRNQSIDLGATLAFNGLNEFVKKGTIADVWQGRKYTSDEFILQVSLFDL